MAKYSRRSAAQWAAMFNQLKGEYYGGLGAGVADISQSLWEQQLPMFESMIEDYYGGAAGLGQMVPGQGGSTAAQQGLQGLMSEYMADITQTALGAYQMPYQAQFGQAPEAEYYRGGYWMPRLEQSRMAGQTGQSALGSCCFIFIEADNGVLDRIARRYRDEHGTEEQRIGYKRIAAWLDRI